MSSSTKREHQWGRLHVWMEVGGRTRKMLHVRIVCGVCSSVLHASWPPTLTWRFWDEMSSPAFNPSGLKQFEVIVSSAQLILSILWRSNWFYSCKYMSPSAQGRFFITLMYGFSSRHDACEVSVFVYRPTCSGFEALEPTWVVVHSCAGLNFGTMVWFCHSIGAYVSHMFHWLTQRKWFHLFALRILCFYESFPQKAFVQWPGYWEAVSGISVFL